MDLILLRHGETIHNLEGRYCSDDCSLSEKGIYQMERASDKIHKMIIDRVMVSPLARTVESYDIIKQYHNFPASINNKIREVDAGYFKGKTFQEGMELYPKETEEYMYDYIANPLPGGESIKQAYDRAGDVLRDIRNQRGNILMITHGGFIALILSYILGNMKDYHRFDIDNGSFTLIKMDNFPRIRYINRT